MKKLCLAFLMLGLAIAGGTRLGLAQDLQEKSSDDVIASMLRQGWKIKQDGVLQRDRGPHQTETFVFGSAGFTWKLQDLQKQLAALRQAYAANPRPSLRKVILGHRKEIASTQKMIDLARADEESGKTSAQKASCSINFGYSASSSSLTSQQGVTANASANFSSTCGFTGEVYAYSISRATVNGAPTQQEYIDGPRSGSSVTASANTSQAGGAPDCYSYSYASMTSSDFSSSHASYSTSASTYTCPPPSTPPSPTINGTNYIYASGCVTTTWTSSVSGGTSPYTYSWTWNGVAVGTGSSYSRTVCSGTTYSYTSNTLGLTVTDSASRSGSTSIYVDVEKAGSSGGGGSCLVTNPDGSKYIQPTPCP